NHFLPRHHNIFAHGTIALNAQGLVISTCVGATVSAGGTALAVGIRVHGATQPRLQVIGYLLAQLCYFRAYLMTRYDWKLYHGVLTEEGIQVGSAKAYKIDF